MENYFSTREIAYIILSLAGVIVFIVGAFYQKVSLLPLIKSSTNSKILIPIFGYLLYIVVCFIIGLNANLWTDKVLGTLGLWVVSTGIALLFEIVLSKKDDIFKKAAVSSIGLTTFLFTLEESIHSLQFG